ncbi:MAG: ABC transporter substrate-binding protein [Blautia sp.]|nr:ABC transporter substrate-binding protein [Blautia sp.]
MKHRNSIVLMVSLLLAGMCITAGNAAGASLSDDRTDNDSGDGLVMVGVSQVGSESDWRIAMTQSIKSAFTTDEGFYLIFQDAQQKQENQIKAMRNFILQEVDYIVLDPIVETGWDAILQEAKDTGIPVIIVDRMVDADPQLYTCWIGSDFEKEGRDAAEWLAAYLGTEGRGEEEIHLVTLQGTLGSSAQIGRTKGFSEVLDEHENWKMLAREDGDFTQAKGQEAMEKLLERYDDIDVLISENDNMTFGAIDAIQKAGKTCGPNGDMIVISFDAVEAALDAMIDGEINADFECNPLQGPQLLETIRNLEKGMTVDKIQHVDETYFDATMNLPELKAERKY